jgi:glyoxylase-like metal-dependent hydrolase (beta-lactamase superfamily II)
MLRPRNVTRGVELFPARTPTLPPATHTNSYALGDREVLLVEPATPYDDERRAWIAWARGLEAQGRRLVAIAITHHHSDHVGGAAFLARELGLPLWAHEATASRVPGLDVSRTLDDGAEIKLDGPTPARWRALLTPGHAPGHLCFWNEDTGALVVGDMVASVGTILIDPKDGDMIEYLAQLARLADLGAAVALPAHGEPIDAPAALFHKYIDHRRMREAKVVDALARRGDAAASLDTLVPEVYGDTSPMLWPIARMSLEAHLLKLEREGRAACRDALWSAA